MNDVRKIGPWLSAYPLPERPQVITVTHDMAGDWLDNRNREAGENHQRKLSRVKVQAYTEQMDAGLWRLTHQGLAFDMEGWMFDGQHRLQALRNSSLNELDFWVFPDEPTDVFDRVDTGYGRQARQLYDGAYASIITSAVRYLGEVPGVYITSMPPAMQLTEVKKWPELVTHAAAVAACQYKAKVPGSPHLALMALAERTEYRDKIPSWLDGITHGLDLSAGDPRLLVRERFIGRVGRQRSTELIWNTLAKGWNWHTQGIRKQTLSWRADEGMISVIGTGADLSAGLVFEE